MSSRPTPLRRLHVRLALGAVVAILAAAGFAVHDRGTPAPVPRAAAAATRPAPRPPGVVTPDLRLRVLHEAVGFTDTTAGHTGAPRLAAGGGILVDLDAHTILWSLRAHLPLAPASTTKVMTSLVALENFSPDLPVTVTPAALTQQPDETVMGLSSGEELSVQDLLAGMLLVSGNDAATTLAEDTVGTTRFVDAMNAQEAALGLRDSHFVSPVGLDDPQQSASAYDLAAITAVDVTHFPLFARLVATRDETLPQTPTHPAYRLHNLNRLLQIYPPAVGVKPGWTGNAGACLVAMATRGGHHLIGVLLNAPSLYTDMRALLDWGFTQEGLPSQLPPSPSPRPQPKSSPAPPA